MNVSMCECACGAVQQTSDQGGHTPTLISIKQLLKIRYMHISVLALYNFTFL